MLEEMAIEKKIALIRKDRDSRGGGVAIAYDTNMLTLSKITLNTLKGLKKFEIVAARGKLRGYKQALTFFSCYIPPKFTKAESLQFLDALSNAIAESKSKSEGWIAIGGDLSLIHI